MVYSWRVNRVHQGVLYFQNAVEFRGGRLNVRSFTPVRKWRPPSLRYSQPHYVQLFYSEFHLNRTMNFKSMDRNSITPPNTARLSCTDVHETNTQQFLSYTKFYPNRMKMQKMKAKFTLSPSAKHGFHCFHFHGPQVCPRASRDNLYQRSPKPVNKCGKYGYAFIYTLM